MLEYQAFSHFNRLTGTQKMSHTLPNIMAKLSPKHLCLLVDHVLTEAPEPLLSILFFHYQTWMVNPACKIVQKEALNPSSFVRSHELKFISDLGLTNQNFEI
jgi:hypothetical protein